MPFWPNDTLSPIKCATIKRLFECFFLLQLNVVSEHGDWRFTDALLKRWVSWATNQLKSSCNYETQSHEPSSLTSVIHPIDTARSLKEIFYTIYQFIWFTPPSPVNIILMLMSMFTLIFQANVFVHPTHPFNSHKPLTHPREQPQRK